MGALDDAIREHIELKRQHGASETDLERQEREALGPARRETAAPAEPVDTAEPAEPAAEDFDTAATQVPDVAEPEPETDPAFEAAPAADFELEPNPFAEPDPLAEPLPAEPAPAAGPDDPEEEDVLEETPEFLQETPEHDRLWFEQKAPRDFDFDE